ncbi:MAG TPA: Mur ligase family protein, partial [Patescibacteria group bacterium]|nr:Mur ligase family protein [Patescibacteria group bacterium]
MKHLFLTTIGKTISVISKTLQKGNGSTWPGHIALSLHKNFVRDIFRNAPTQVILVIGTNGKTTTAKMLTTILRENGYSVFQNTSGANLLNGIASATLLHTNIFGKLTADFAVFEVDENNVPFVLQEITP